MTVAQSKAVHSKVAAQITLPAKARRENLRQIVRPMCPTQVFDSTERGAGQIVVNSHKAPSFVRFLLRRAGLERHFLVVFWEQHGTDRSYHSDVPPESMTLRQACSFGLGRSLLRKDSRARQAAGLVRAIRPQSAIRGNRQIRPCFD